MHYTCSDPSLCIRHTHASMCEWADAVLEGPEALNVGEFKELQTLTGLHYIEGGLIWDPVARLYIDCGTFPYHDAMHALEASGGIAQYQLNVFVHNILSHGAFSLKDIDDFAINVKFRRSHGKLARTFFPGPCDIPGEGISGCSPQGVRFRGVARV